ncbi:MAG: hypothetical protein J5706_06995, partial [Elusimicrobiales bacterium]|nr:hypothetical protein [Elusimicrobiales bacterium]
NDFYFVYDHFPEEARKKEMIGQINFAEKDDRPEGDGIMPYNDKKRKLRQRSLSNTTGRFFNFGKASVPKQKNKVCQVCVLHSFSRGRGFTNFISHKFMVMHLKPGCRPPKEMIAVFEGKVPKDTEIYEYDCDKELPVPKDLCTGWLVNYYCD